MSSPPTLDDLTIDGHRVFVRVDFNVPLDGERVTDDTRIRGALPTIEALRGKGARVILASHLGRPKGKPDPAYTMLPAAARLAELLDVEVVFSHDTIGDDVVQLAKELPPGGVMVLENLRFHAGEQANDPEFARQLAAIGELYVDDAFGAMHRPDASITGVPKILGGAIGKLVQREVDALGVLVGTEGRLERAPFAAILGGSKVSDKIGVIEALSKRVDHLFIGGAMAYTFLAAEGKAVGSSRVEADKLELARSLLTKCANRSVKVHLPFDHVVAERFEAGSPPKIVTSIPDGWMGLDIGPATLRQWAEIIGRCQTVFWNGPMGVFEWESFSAGTRGVAEALAHCPGLTIVGGGDSAAAITQFGLADRVSHVSTGGGASLEYIEHGDLPGLSALRSGRA
jgi:phosphoglycerate kinase